VIISTPNAGNILWASLIRLGATTHSFNTSQRLVDLPIPSQTGSVVQMQVTAEPNPAPPGWYMLFLTNHDRVPSVARRVHLAAAPAAAIPVGSYAQTVLGTRGSGRLLAAGRKGRHGGLRRHQHPPWQLLQPPTSAPRALQPQRRRA
jgi:hypothetical protein